jgi:hypothetical protein
MCCRYSTFEAAKADILRDAEARAIGSVPVDSRLRVLVLCRVLMGRIYVSGEHMDQAVKDLRSKVHPRPIPHKPSRTRHEMKSDP